LQQEKATTKEGWFDMKAPEMTEELEADIEAMQMRGSTASWSAYKKKDHKNTPKFFQVSSAHRHRVVSLFLLVSACLSICCSLC